MPHAGFDQKIVSTQPDQSRMAQEAVLGPFQKTNSATQFRFDPLDGGCDIRFVLEGGSAANQATPRRLLELTTVELC